MTPILPPATPAAKVPSTAAWLLLSLVLTTMLAVGRWTQPPTAPAARADQYARRSQPAPGRPEPTRRVVLGRPALPPAGKALAAAAL